MGLSGNRQPPFLPIESWRSELFVSNWRSFPVSAGKGDDDGGKFVQILEEEI